MEKKILATALNDAAAAKQLQELVDFKEFQPDTQIILKAIFAYYATDPGAPSVDRDLLIKGFERSIQKDHLRTMVANVVKGLPTDTSGANVLQELKEYKAHVIGQKLATLLASGASTSDVAPVMESYQRFVSGQTSQANESEESFQGASLAGLVAERFDQSELIQLWPDVLNQSLDGGARRGHHVCVFAPTEMGKTLFVINAVAGFLSQNLKVLYIGNEDPASDILMRLATRLLRRNKYEIMDNPAAADRELAGLGWGNFNLVSMAPGTFGRINSLCASGAYDVVVLDQLRNLDVQSDGRTQALERAATEARNLARRHDLLCISVTQAADSASGKRVLNRGDVDSSNVGIPGQMDLMVGIGATEDEENQNIRWLSFPKNKISGKHDPIPVTIDPTISMVMEGM